MLNKIIKIQIDRKFAVEKSKATHMDMMMKMTKILGQSKILMMCKTMTHTEYQEERPKLK